MRQLTSIFPGSDCLLTRFILLINIYYLILHGTCALGAENRVADRQKCAYLNFLIILLNRGQGSILIIVFQKIIFNLVYIHSDSANGKVKLLISADGNS